MGDVTPIRRTRGVGRVQHAKQPRARKRPFVLHGRRRQIHRRRGLLDTEAGEKSKRDNLCLARIGEFQLRQRLVDGDDVGQAGIGTQHRLVQFHLLSAGAVLDPAVVARAFDQDAAHRQRGGRKEVAAAIPLFGLTRDAKIGFVHERGRLQRLMRLPFAGEPRPRELAQFVIHFRQQLAGGAGRSGSRGADVTERRNYDTREHRSPQAQLRRGVRAAARAGRPFLSGAVRGRSRTCGRCFPPT